MVAVSPDQFSTAALAWVGSLVLVISGISVALVKIAPVIQQVKDLFARMERQGSRLDSQQRQITAVALNTPAPASEPSKVEVVNASSNPVEVHDAGNKP